ncbi:MAG TPA: hypothetical protein VGI99_02235 [Gemmataceae bacterium]|jgi:hypothetical protein
MPKPTKFKGETKHEAWLRENGHRFGVGSSGKSGGKAGKTRSGGSKGGKGGGS